MSVCTYTLRKSAVTKYCVKSRCSVNSWCANFGLWTSNFINHNSLGRLLRISACPYENLKPLNLKTRTQPLALERFWDKQEETQVWEMVDSHSSWKFHQMDWRGNAHHVRMRSSEEGSRGCKRKEFESLIPERWSHPSHRSLKFDCFSWNTLNFIFHSSLSASKCISGRQGVWSYHSLQLCYNLM